MEDKQLKRIAMESWFNELKEKGHFKQWKDYSEWEKRNDLVQAEYRKEFQPSDPQERADYNKVFN